MIHKGDSVFIKFQLTYLDEGPSIETLTDIEGRKVLLLLLIIIIIIIIIIYSSII
jgi:hypothetical protein